MARNLQLQVLRGTKSQFLTLQAGVDPDTGLPTSPLALGEMFFATDTGSLFFGTPGTGQGYITIGDTTAVNETMMKCLLELKAMRLALTKLACEDGRACTQDFDPEEFDATESNQTT